MKISELRGLQQIQSDADDIEYELKHINDLLANATGTLKVKINTRWIIEIPAALIIEHAKERKNQLVSKMKTLELKIDDSFAMSKKQV
jgi:hypothetical protein